jgi:hypothetical protein
LKDCNLRPSPPSINGCFIWSVALENEVIGLFAAPVMRPPRPIGITILVILQIVAGIFDFLIAALLVIVYALAFSFFGMTVSALGIFVIPLVVVFLILGIFSFILAFGLWTGKHWAWVSTVVLSIIGLALSIIGSVFGNYLGIVLIVLYVVMLGYLSTFRVRMFFVRVPYPGYYYPPPPPVPYAPQTMGMPPQPPPSPYYPPQANPRPPMTIARTMMCPNCFCPVSVSEGYCGRCGTRLR